MSPAWHRHAARYRVSAPLPAAFRSQWWDRRPVPCLLLCHSPAVLAGLLSSAPSQPPRRLRRLYVECSASSNNRVVGGTHRRLGADLLIEVAGEARGARGRIGGRSRRIGAGRLRRTTGGGVPSSVHAVRLRLVSCVPALLHIRPL